MRHIGLAIAAVIALAVPAHAQKSIDPGMTRTQVEAQLGAPLSARSYGSFTYMLYRNGCERRCGMNDLVVLEGDRVVDAVFRSSSRKYTGTSSSPRMYSAAEASRGITTPPPARLTIPDKKPEV